MPGTQICDGHVEAFRRTPLYLVLWANIAPRGHFFLSMTYIFWTAYVNYLKFGISAPKKSKVYIKFYKKVFI